MSSDVTLTFLSGPSDGRTLRVSPRGDAPEITFGRTDQCVVSLPYDAEISRSHARLVFRGQAWLLEDCGSSNGTFLGEFAQSLRIMAPTPVRTGHVFRVGRSRFRFDGDGLGQTLAAQARSAETSSA